MAKQNKTFLDRLSGLFKTTAQLQRIVILSGVALVLLSASFGGYYYYDRYYQPQDTKVEQTLRMAEDAVEQDPENPALRVDLAEKYLAFRKYEDAITMANSVLPALPDNERILMVLGVANILKGSPNDGIPYLEKYIGFYENDDMVAFNKTFVAACYYLGDAYLMTEQPEKAVSILERGYKLNSADADLMYKLGVAYTKVKQYDAAKKILHQATLFVPDFKEVYQQLANVFSETKEPALEFYAKGMVAYCDKDYATALELLKSSVAEQTDSAPTYNGLGMVYEAMNELLLAKENYEKALALDPNYLSSANALDRINTLLK